MSKMVDWTHEQASGTNILHWYEIDYHYFPHSFEGLLFTTIGRFFEGNYPKRTLFQKIFPLAAALYFGLLFLAFYFFPAHYSPFTNTISDLGNPILNPVGFGFFSAAFLYLAVIMIPFYQFIYKHLSKLNTVFARLAIATNVVASSGFITLAFFPNTSDTLAIHLLAAFVSFGGTILGGLFYYVIIVIDAIRKKGTRRLIVVAGTGANVIIGITTTQLVNLPTFTINNTTMLPLWEWILFIAIAASVVLFFNAMPEIGKKMAVYRILDERVYFDPTHADIRLPNQLPADDPYQPIRTNHATP
jgi:hypothetical protein